MSSLELCYPQLLNWSCRGLECLHSEAVLLYTLFSSIAVITVALNLLVIISISHFRHLQTPPNLLLLALAISDLLVGLLVMPVESMRIIESCWLLGDIMCSLSFFLSFTLTSASVGIIVLISIDRIVAINYPLQYINVCVCQFFYELSCEMSSPSTHTCVCVFYNGLILKDNFSLRDRHCNGECIVVNNYVSEAVDIVVTFIGPCSVIIVLYTRVFTVVVSQTHSMNSHITAGTGCKVKATKSQRKAAGILGIVILVYLFTFCPYYYPSLAGENNLQVLGIVTWLLYLNSCLNQLMYVFLYPWFKKAIKFIATLKILEQNSSHANML
nr:trace amine-associated receptor 13c-like [Pseudochaenichthys georgianus]